MCIPHYREIPGGKQISPADFDSQAERDVYGADGRWLRRGAAERTVGCDRTACYSGRVSRTFAIAEVFVPDKVPGAAIHEP